VAAMTLASHGTVFASYFKVNMGLEGNVLILRGVMGFERSLLLRKTLIFENRILKSVH